MKNKLLLLAAVALAAVSACKSPTGEAVDLSTGKTIQIVKDEEKGYMVNAETKKPVYLYVIKASNDTFYGRTGAKVNNEITRSSKGRYKYLGDAEYVFRGGTYKAKSEAATSTNDDDDEVAITGDDYKYKVQSDGDVKIKNGDYKKKVEADGDIKIKDGDTKIKVDDGKVKVKQD